MSSFITRIHRYIRDSRTTRRHVSVSSDTSPIGSSKEYPRMPRMLLPAPQPTRIPIEDTLQKNMAFNHAVSNRAFAADEFGSLFGHALRARGESSHRAYASEGTLFPIETYVIGTTIESQFPGVFHYHPIAHALEALWDLPEEFSMTKLIRSPLTPLSDTLVVFTARWERGAHLYGDFAYAQALIEAGHMAQNISLVATALGIQHRTVTDCDDQLITSLLNLDMDTEQFVYGVLISPPRTPHNILV